MLRAETLLVEKYGGAGLADPSSIEALVGRVGNIENLGAIAVSGPGGEAGRVTDLVISATELAIAGLPWDSVLDEAAERLVAHAKPFGSRAEMLAWQVSKDIGTSLVDGSGAGKAVMGPELYSAGLMSILLHEAGIDNVVVNPSGYMRRDSRGALDLEVSANGLSHVLDSRALNILPGSPGVDQFLRLVPVKPNIRGYTDVTSLVGAEALHRLSLKPVALRILKGDVAGILRMPPNLGRDPEISPSLSIVEAEVLGAAGNGVVHPTVLELLQNSDVQLLVDSGEPGVQGTVIKRSREVEDGEQIVGIALQNAIALTISDIRMEHQPGVVGRIVDEFARRDLPIIDLVTGGGVIKTFLAKSDKYTDKQHEVLYILSREYGDKLQIFGQDDEDGLTIVTLVGEALKNPEVCKNVESTAISIVGGSGNVMPHRWWPSPSGNAIYVPLSTKFAAEFASQVYDHYFGK